MVCYRKGNHPHDVHQLSHPFAGNKGKWYNVYDQNINESLATVARPGHDKGGPFCLGVGLHRVEEGILWYSNPERLHGG